MPESATLLAHLAAATSRVSVGALVSCVTHRNVAVHGRSVATLDVLSGGRAVCGLGLGWFASEHRDYGIAFPPVAERYEWLEDALRFLPVLWGPGAKSFTGRRLEVPSATCYPRPLRGRIPLLVGGSGERRTLRLAAELADACNLFGDAATVRRKVAALDRHCDDVGRDRLAVEITHLGTVLVGSTPDDARARLERLRLPAKHARLVETGTVGDHVRRVAGLADAGVEHVIVALRDVGPDAVRRFGEVIEAVSSAGIKPGRAATTPS